MFSRSLIANLREKKSVAAESFDSVTILFSDIPSFDLICQSISPIQVISLLNELNIGTDRVLSRYDAYKVESINDSFMV